MRKVPRDGEVRAINLKYTVQQDAAIQCNERNVVCMNELALGKKRILEVKCRFSKVKKKSKAIPVTRRGGP
jgi:hypothetical protein